MTSPQFWNFWPPPLPLVTWGHFSMTPPPKVTSLLGGSSKKWPQVTRKGGGQKSQNGGDIISVRPLRHTLPAITHSNSLLFLQFELWLNERKPNYCQNNITNGEEMSLCRVGSDLYEKIFKHYTKKQWNKYPKELDASVLARLPVRNTWLLYKLKW